MIVSAPAPGGVGRLVKILAGVALALAAYALLGQSGLTEPGRRTAAAALLIATWWVTEALPLEATGLLPIALFPILGISDIKEATASYANQIVFLFLGGMLLGQAMEAWNLHRRFALMTLRVFGGGPSMIIGGFLVATAFVSLWVSNLAAAAMMAPIALSVAATLTFDREDHAATFRASLMLAVAFGASIGGLGTLIGTPPTAQFAVFMEEKLHRPISFLEWLQVGLPIQLVMLPLAWAVLTLVAFRVRGGSGRAGRETIAREQAAMGPWTRPQVLVSLVFLGAGLGWILTPLLAKWDALQGTLAASILSRVTDAGIAIVCAMALFIIPARRPDGHALLTWRDAEKTHWGILLLFGGGLSLADALARHKVDAYIASLAGPLEGAPLFLVLWAFAVGAIILTEFASNTALVAAALPVALGISHRIGVAPEVLLVNVTLAASLGFMLPAGTPPNAVVYSTRLVTMRQMMKAGAWLDVASSLVVPALVWACLKLGLLPGAQVTM
ncbi:Sodium-dependent dicarboxylate transporter SdcS [Phycisphaerales bacterium]|nr:Sodium-dependent dicarboxylate transporter SdcS [Phycisphaerales bacterium]